MMMLSPASAFLAGCVALLLGCGVLFRTSNGRVHHGVAVAALTTALVQFANGLALLDPAAIGLWRRVAMCGELLQPVALLYAGLTIVKTATGTSQLSTLRRTQGIAGVAAVLAALVPLDWTLHSGQDTLLLGLLGRVDYAFILFALAVALAQFEQILRAAREPLRYQIKFVVIGLGAIGGYRIYAASQLLLFPIWQPESGVVESWASLISLSLIAYGFRRMRIQEVRAGVYIAPHVIYGSLTFLVVGLYLFAVGIVGELVRYTGQSLGELFSTVVVFLAVIGLVIAASSRAVRSTIREAVSRNFYRVKYDYRAKWLEVTDAFRSCGTVDAILDRFLDVLGSTFGAGRISIWLHFEADGRFHQVRSVNTEAPPPPLSMTHPVIEGLNGQDGPLGAEELQQIRRRSAESDPFWEGTKAVACIPLRAGDRLMGFVTLSRQPGVRYGEQEKDLLRVMAHHVAMLLSLAYLAEDRRAASELEALHRFSAFCLHDIKNLAARLSLVAQNAEVYGHDPAFQQSAMRTVSGTVKKMMALISKLSTESYSSQNQDQGQMEMLDVQTVLSETVESLNGGLRIRVSRIETPLLPIPMKRDQMQQVFLNVILNAQQACGDNGEIRIATERRGDVAVITVTDNGPGIPPGVLRTIFSPFQTTKKEGLGVGLYECRRIVESHRGTMSISSEPGCGTEVRITLPFARDLCTLSGESKSA